jgi:Phage P22-like portal protein
MADAIDEAQRLYRESLDACREQRQQIEEDLRFSDPSDPQQWDEQDRIARESDPGGSRPCLVFDQVGQYVSNVAGQIEQRPPAMHAIPVGGGADKKVAEKLDGFFRHIEYTSRAQQHYARALTSAARVGVGYLIVRPEYTNRPLNYQEPRISSEGDPLRVVFDPWSVELDGSDANMGYLLTPFGHRDFERLFGEKADKVSFGDSERGYVRDERESINVAEAWRVENKTSNMIVCIGADGDEVALTEDDYHTASQNAGRALEVRGRYADKKKCVYWSRMSGAAMLSKETEYPASGIGIVPVYGYVGWSNGRMRYCGLPRRAMNAQRAYNYHMSESLSYMRSAPRAPYLVPVRGIPDENTKKIWDRLSIDQRAWVPYQDMDEAGPIAAPSRVSPTVNLQNHVQGAQQALLDIQAAIGLYQANLGAPSNETSGVAIDSRKQQGEASTAHFPAHLAASVGQVGKLCVDMIPRLINTKRQLRVLGVDGTAGSVVIDPKQADSVQETNSGLVINPNVGSYDVRVVVGAAFATQRSQAQTAFTEMMRANPGLTPALAPLWAQTLDVPNADKLAQVLTAIAPPEVKAILSPESDKQPTAADLTAQMQQMGQALQEAIQHAKDAQDEADQLRDEAEQAKRAAEDKDDEIAIKAFDSETKRLQVVGAGLKPEDVQRIAEQAIQAAMAQPTPTTDPVEAGEQAEAEAEGEDMATGPSAEVLAILQQQAEHTQQMLEQQGQLTNAIGALIQNLSTPRKRVPVRDKAGNISHVVESLGE